MPTCFSFSYDFFESFPLICSSIDSILRFWFTQDFCCRLRSASFCFSFALYILSVASLDVISLRSLCESCPRSRFWHKPTSISFSILIFCFTSSWAGVRVAVLVVEGSVSVEGWGLVLSFIVVLCFMLVLSHF